MQSSCLLQILCSSGYYEGWEDEEIAPRTYLYVAGKSSFKWLSKSDSEMQKLELKSFWFDLMMHTKNS